MRITDLLDKRSISLDAAPKSKEEALNDAVALMWKATADRCLRGKKKVQRALVKELQSRMVNAVQ